MVVIQKCNFCGSSIATGTGKLFIRKDAKMIWLCGNKCEKNLNKLGRKARKTGWTEEYKIEKKARMAAAAHEHSEHASVHVHEGKPSLQGEKSAENTAAKPKGKAKK